jgi:hypothetical protein
LRCTEPKTKKEGKEGEEEWKEEGKYERMKEEEFFLYSPFLYILSPPQ